jgi:hypothetical protein
MAGITRRDILKYAAYGSVFAGSGLLTTRVAAGEEFFVGFADAGGEKPLAIASVIFMSGKDTAESRITPGIPMSLLLVRHSFVIRIKRKCLLISIIKAVG